jgi:hypothetical protein
MVTSTSRFARAASFWLAAVVVVLGGSQAAGARGSTMALLCLAALIPPALFLMLGASEPPSVAEVLFAVGTQRGTRS